MFKTSNCSDCCINDFAESCDRPNPTIEISTQLLKNAVEIRISDNGEGTPRKHLEQIFEAFFTTKPIGVETGLE